MAETEYKYVGEISNQWRRDRSTSEECPLPAACQAQNLRCRRGELRRDSVLIRCLC